MRQGRGGVSLHIAVELGTVPLWSRKRRGRCVQIKTAPAIEGAHAEKCRARRERERVECINLSLFKRWAGDRAGE